MRKFEEAVIFDFDGVVVLSEPVHRQAWVDLALEYGETVPEGFLEKGIGSHDIGLADELFAAWEGRHTRRAILEGKRRCYQTRLLTQVTLVDGVLEAIEALSRAYPLALATSSCRGDIRPVFERFGLDRFFTEVLTVEDVTYPKPDPEIYLSAASRLRVDPGRCWVFEDSVPGITAARGAGMNVVALLTTYPPEKLAPYRFAIPDFRDLPAIQERLADGARGRAAQGR